MIAARVALTSIDVALRKAVAADEPFVRALFIEARKGDFASLNLPVPHLAALLDQQFRAQRIGYAQTFPEAEHLIVARAGVPVGRVIVALQPGLPGRTLHLLDITLAEAARGSGLGTDIITGLAAAGPTLRASRMALSVFPANVRARKLYERLGFVTVAEDAALRMVKVLG